MVLFVDEFKVSRSLAKTLRRLRTEGRWRVTKEQAFERVMRACAAPRPDQDGTWITDAIVHAYCALHAQGLAHSVEVWSDGDLIGGLYGVGLGRMFYGESMFARATDASKVALAALVAMLRDADFPRDRLPAEHASSGFAGRARDRSPASSCTPRVDAGGLALPTGAGCPSRFPT